MADEPAARYPSDLTDAQWELIAPMVAVRHGGRPAEHDRRRIVDAILYVTRTGCSWRQLPHDFPPTTPLSTESCNPYEDGRKPGTLQILLATHPRIAGCPWTAGGPQNVLGKGS